MLGTSCLCLSLCVVWATKCGAVPASGLAEGDRLNLAKERKNAFGGSRQVSLFGDKRRSIDDGGAV